MSEPTVVKFKIKATPMRSYIDDSGNPTEHVKINITIPGKVIVPPEIKVFKKPHVGSRDIGLILPSGEKVYINPEKTSELGKEVSIEGKKVLRLSPSEETWAYYVYVTKFNELAKQIEQKK